MMALRYDSEAAVLIVLSWPHGSPPVKHAAGKCRWAGTMASQFSGTPPSTQQAQWGCGFLQASLQICPANPGLEPLDCLSTRLMVTTTSKFHNNKIKMVDLNHVTFINQLNKILHTELRIN